jgi:hypothetical protein
MPVLDTRTECLSPRLPLIALIGLCMIPAEVAQTGAALSIAVTPGTAILEDHAQQVNGRGAMTVNDGNTLAASSELISDGVIYWNPDVQGMFLVIVDGAAVLTSVGATAPTDAEIDTAVGTDASGETYTWARFGRVKFTRDSGTVITIAQIDHTVRPLGVDPDAKAATSSTYQELDAVGADAELYEFSHTDGIELDAANIANGDLLTTKAVPPFYGKIGGIRGIVTKVVTTAAKAADINAEINTTNLTGGVVGLTSANCTPLGKVNEGTAITAANTFKPGDTWSLEAANVVAFVEGRIKVEVDFYRLRTV